MTWDELAKLIETMSAKERGQRVAIVPDTQRVPPELRWSPCYFTTALDMDGDRPELWAYQPGA